MAYDYIPRRDIDFLNWSRNFVQHITAAPAQWGLSPAQATQCASLQNAFANALRIANDPSTRTPPSIVNKNNARSDLERSVRPLVRIIQGTSGVSDGQKVELGITVRDAKASPVPRPTEPPRMFVRLLYGSTVRVRLRGKDSSRRGKPRGVAGAMVYSFVGSEPPATLDGWTCEGGTTRTTTDITLGARSHGIKPGDMVWFTACWFNPRMQRGPVATPKPTYIQCPTLLLADATLRLAA